MIKKIIVRLHVLFVIVWVTSILLRYYGWSFTIGIDMFRCIGYFLTMIACIPVACSALRRTQPTVKLVFALSGIFIVEIVAGCLTLVYSFGLLFMMGATSKATGHGYEVRSQSSFGWPQQYLLYTGNVIIEKCLGGIQANEEDFQLEGSIITISDLDNNAIHVTIKQSDKDTTIHFIKKKK